MKFLSFCILLFLVVVSGQPPYSKEERQNAYGFYNNQGQYASFNMNPQKNHELEFKYGNDNEDNEIDNEDNQYTPDYELEEKIKEVYNVPEEKTEKPIPDYDEEQNPDEVYQPTYNQKPKYDEEYQEPDNFYNKPNDDDDDYKIVDDGQGHMEPSFKKKIKNWASKAYEKVKHAGKSMVRKNFSGRIYWKTFSFNHP